MKEIIEKYIQFAIDNGYKIKSMNIGKFCLFSNTGAGYCELYIHFDYGKNNFKNINIIELITSKEFIESIARGFEKEIIIEDGFYCINNKFDGIIAKDKNTAIKKIIYYITTNQAVAIRDNKLEYFINNLINHEKLKIL